MTKPDLFVGVPVYNGVATVVETLECIQRQTYRNIRVVISIDGNDTASALACEPYTSDPRFEIVVHTERRGWHGNLNWLIAHADLPYFSFWQQDDLADDTFLEHLRAELERHPEAVVAYADIQWFGTRTDLESAPSIIGSTSERVVRHIRALRHEPMVGLLRASAIDRTRDAITPTLDESCQEEFVFLARLAAVGSFRRVEGTLYRKRAHGTNAYQRFIDFPEYRRRRGWISMGIGLIGVAASVFPTRHRRDVIEFVAERLAVALPGLGYFYLPAPTQGEISRFVRELLVEAHLGSTLTPSTRPNVVAGHTIHPAVGEGVAAWHHDALRRDDMSRQIDETGSLHLATGIDGEGRALLGGGWSTTDKEGVWSDADRATILLPRLPRGTWRIELRGTVYQPRTLDRPAQVTWSVDGGSAVAADLAGGAVVALVEVGRARQAVIQLGLPDAASPKDENLSDDPRHLGYFLFGVVITRV